MPWKWIGNHPRHDKTADQWQVLNVSELKRSTSIQCSTDARARVLAVVALGLIGAGIWNADGSLGAIGIAGWGFIIATRLIGHANLRSLELYVDAPNRAITATAFPVNVTVENRRKWTDARSIHCTLEWPGETQSDHYFEAVPADSAVATASHATPKTRNDGNHIRVSLSSNFPLGLFHFSTTRSIDHRLCVIPQARPPRETPTDGAILDASEIYGATLGMHVGDIRGVRSWTHGDRVRQILWPASMRSLARGAGPVVREMDPPGNMPERCLIVLHSYAGGGALIHPERFDRALELATGWIEHLHRAGIRTRLIADFESWQIRNTRTRTEIIRMRERFASAKRRHSTEAHELQEAIASNAIAGETVILISDMPPATWRRDVTLSSNASVISNIHAR